MVDQELLQQSSVIPNTTSLVDSGFNFNVIVPKPFNLAEQSKEDLMRLRDEGMDKVRTCENRMNTFYNDYQVFAESWRVKSRKTVAKKPNGLFNSKSGETHRAVETLGTFWLKNLTSLDPFFESSAEGFDDFGNEIPPEELYANDKVLIKQLRMSHYKEKLLRSLRSCALFGTVIFEEPFVSVPYKNGTARFEYTDFVFRSLLKIAFDTNVWDINLSDFIATIDFPDKYVLKRWSRTQGEFWDNAAIEKFIKENGTAGTNQGNSMNKSTSAWNRVNESKSRAGYTEIDNNVFEFINYHGKLDVENSVIAAYWESEGRTDNPEDFDFTLGILNGTEPVRFHETQFGTWRSRFKVAHFKTFEDEPLGYGAGRIGRKLQREIDLTMSRAQDTLMKAVYSMFLVGRYAGLKANQLNINPNGLIDVEDVDQVKPLPIDLSAIAQALGMIGVNREEFRSTVGAHSNLQAQITRSSATEAMQAHQEASRGAFVHSEIISETFLREHIETMHYNNLVYLDEPIWVSFSGKKRAGYYNKENLPKNVGIEIRVLTDRYFRPEYSDSLIKGLQMFSSVRNNFPPSVNAIPFLAKEWFRTLGLNPQLLNTPVPVADQLAMALQKMQKQNQTPLLGNEMEAESFGDETGQGRNLEDRQSKESLLEESSLVGGL